MEREAVWVQRFCIVLTLATYGIAVFQFHYDKCNQGVPEVGAGSSHLIFASSLILRCGTCTIIDWSCTSLTDPCVRCSNTLPYFGKFGTKWKRPLYGIALTGLSHSMLRAIQIVGISWSGNTEPDWYQIEGGWVHTMQFSNAGTLLAFAHAMGGFACGWLRASRRIRRFFQPVQPACLQLGRGFLLD